MSGMGGMNGMQGFGGMMNGQNGAGYGDIKPDQDELLRLRGGAVRPLICTRNCRSNV